MAAEEDHEATRRYAVEHASAEALASLTPAQLDLMKKDRSDIEQEARVFSFDLGQFEARLTRGEDWHRVIQAHLYLDHAVSRMVAASLKNPEAVRLSRMGFAQKLELVDALGLLPTDLVSAVSAVNRLRNRIAHQLDFEISESDLTNLRNAIPTHLRDAARSKATHPSPLLPIATKGLAADIGHIRRHPPTKACRQPDARRAG